MLTLGALEESGTHPGISLQAALDSKEVRMTWEISAAANAVIGIAYLVIAYIIIGGLVRTDQLTTTKLGLATGLIFLTCGVLGLGELRRQRPATVAGGDAPT